MLFSMLADADSMNTLLTLGKAEVFLGLRCTSGRGQRNVLRMFVTDTYIWGTEPDLGNYDVLYMNSSILSSELKKIFS
jgi:hypothetical protein